MEAASATDAPRGLEGDKAQRIIAAMRASVATRGAAASTFDHVAREAGVSRGLLHYYFGSKERLLVEVVRHDCKVTNGALEEFVEEEPGSQAVTYEMLSASRHSDEIRAELAELYRRWRRHLAEALREKENHGVVHLQADPDSV